MGVNIKKRIAYIDLVECIAMFLVLIYHSSIIIGYNTSFSIVGSSSVASVAYYWFRGFMSLGVPLFFIANGYLLFTSNFNLKKHALKTLRFAIITVIWTLITIFTLQALRGESHSIREILDAVLHLNMQNYTNHLWFMGALVCLYIVFPVLKIAYDNHKKAFAFFLVLCFVLTFGNTVINRVDSLVHIISGSPVIATEQWLDIFNPFQWKYSYAFVYFCLGGLMPYIVRRIKALKLWALLSALILLCSSAAVTLWSIKASNILGENYDIVWNNYNSCFILINAVCVFTLCTAYEGKKKAMNAVVTAISKNTMGIYFVHLLLIYAAYELCGEIHIGGFFVGGILFGLAALIMSTLISMLLKKIPVIRKLF